MTTNIGESGVLYNQVQIPDLNDAADIREALRIYHYGSKTSNPTSTPEGEEFFANSIAALAEIECMKAANEQRKDQGYAQAYDEAAFASIILKYSLDVNDTQQYLFH
jgi:hypothetical protein